MKRKVGSTDQFKSNKNIVPEEEDSRKKYIIRFNQGEGKRASKVLCLDGLLSCEIDAAADLIGELEIVDTGDLIRNAIALNSAFTENHITSKLCSIILHDEKGEQYSEEFYQTCVHTDLIKPTEDFFNGEGGDLLRGIARVVYAPLLKQMEGQNNPISLFDNRLKGKIEELKADGKITNEIEELLLSNFHEMQ
jgi:hypothetical protein